MRVLEGSKRLIRVAALTVLACAFAVFASADPVTFTGSGTTADGSALSASATFDVIGGVLTISLTNTAAYNNATNGDLTPSQLLTGLFWSWSSGTPTLTPGTATIASGSLLQANTCSPSPCSSTTTNVGGEFRYQAGSFGFAPGTTMGIASSGYIGGAGNMGGTNLDDPNAVDGMNFGIAPTGFVAGNGNGGIDGEPIISGSVVLTLNGASGLLPGDITNVYFTYGTSPEASITNVPEPTTLTMLLFGAGLAGTRALRNKRR